MDAQSSIPEVHCLNSQHLIREPPHSLGCHFALHRLSQICFRDRNLRESEAPAELKSRESSAGASPSRLNKYLLRTVEIPCPTSFQISKSQADL